jgi:hypothetical protein
MVISMTRSLCEQASARSCDRGRATAPTALWIFLTTATDSALTNINTMSRISLRCDHSTSENCLAGLNSTLHSTYLKPRFRLKEAGFISTYGSRYPDETGSVFSTADDATAHAILVAQELAQDGSWH